MYMGNCTLSETYVNSIGPGIWSGRMASLPGDVTTQPLKLTNFIIGSILVNTSKVHDGS